VQKSAMLILVRDKNYLVIWYLFSYDGVMMRVIFAVVVAAVFAFGGAQAASITVGNASFEDPVLSSGGWSDATPPSWNEPTSDGPGSFTEFIPDFASEGTQHQGMNIGEFMWQVLGVTWAPDTAYTLTVGSGNRSGHTAGSGGLTRIALESSEAAIGTSLAMAEIDPFIHSAPGTFADFSLVYTTGPVAPAGTIRINLVNAGAGRSHFDNVRLDAVVIPEPASIGLAGFGLLAILRRRRR